MARLNGIARDGRRVCATIDDLLWSLLVQREGGAAEARRFARQVFRANRCEKPSETLRRCAIKRIADPKLLKQYYGEAAAGVNRPT